VKRTFKTIAVRVLPFILILVIVALTLFLPHTGQTDETKRVIRVWNVDTFEGGRGSRTNFLKSVARSIRKKDKNVYYLVTSYTLEGARYACEEGDFPDLISFGLGLSSFAEQSLPVGYSFAGGTLAGNALAYPWCRGSYFLFSLTEEFDEEGTTAISCGGENLSSLVAYLEGIKGETVDSLTAYTGFLNGTYRYLLGTQRDWNRFSARGVEVYFKPLTQYCDLYQYISILSAEHVEDCRAFVRALLGEEMQNRLSEIGMYALSQSDPPNAEKTVSVFSSADALDRLREAVRANDTKILEKNLKSI